MSLFFKSETDRLVERAEEHLRSTGLIPLDLFAELNAAGIDVTELERNVRNG